MANPSPQPAPPPPEQESADLFDYALLRDYGGFTIRAVTRHRRLAAGTFLAVLGVAALALWAMPRKYRADTRILAQRNALVSTLANPAFGRPFEADAPTRAARETVLRWDNLLDLVEQTKLVEKTSRNRAPIVRLRDGLTRLLSRRTATHAEHVEALAYTLEKRLTVDVGEGNVTIAAEWSDPSTAYELVEAALQNFLEARHATEVSIVGEAISVLEQHAAEVQKEIKRVSDQLEQLEKETRTTRRTGVVIPRAYHPDEELARLNALYNSKRRALTDLEDFRQRRLSELQAQLVQQRSVYAEQHPSVLSTQQSIASLSGSSPQIEELRTEIAGLEKEIVRRGGQPGEASAPPRMDPMIIAAAAAGPESEDPRVEAVRGELRIAYNKYASLRERIDTARMEMDSYQAAFKYRYAVIAPPQVPKTPRSPQPGLVMVAAILGGIAFAVFASVAADVRSGLVVERWQIERDVELPVLAETKE